MPRAIDISEARRAIREKVIELARRRGVNSPNVQDSDVIPDTGLLDSVGIMELIMWFESRFALTIDQVDLTLDNFGTVDAMAHYLEKQ
jgi:D-alanine--poly(phosphoribitol) ligase subunit 2